MKVFKSLRKDREMNNMRWSYKTLAVMFATSMILSSMLLLSGLSTKVYGVNPIGISRLAQDENGVYQIETSAKLYGFAQLVNKEEETTANAILTDDIELNDGKINEDTKLEEVYEWKPIGWYKSYSEQCPYRGKKGVRGICGRSDGRIEGCNNKGSVS